MAGIPAVLFTEHLAETNDYTYNVREPGGALLASFEPDGENLHYYHFDALGSTVLVTNGSGTVSDTFAYDAWGNALSGGDGLKPYQYVGELGYYSHTAAQGSALADLMQLGVRFYDPEIGRFTQRDPAGDGLNWYAYVGGNPIVGVDPSGLGLFLPLPIPTPADLAAAAYAHKVWKCAHQMQKAAEDEVRKAGYSGMHNGPGDAMKHCVGSCKMEVHCPPGTAKTAGYGHEVKACIGGVWQKLWGEDETLLDESNMDFHNNAKGRDWGNIIKRNPGKGWSCMEGCARMLGRGDLKILPRHRW